MRSKSRLWFALAAVLAIGSSVGCYTLLKHPRLQTEANSTTSSHAERVTFAESCVGCHDTATLSYYHRAVPLPGEFVSPRWDYYYDYPWWIPYYAGATPDPQTDAEGEQKQRPFDRRQLRQPEEPAPVQASSSSQTPASPAAVAKPAETGNATSAEPPRNQDTGKRDERRDGDSKSSGRRERKPPQ